MERVPVMTVLTIALQHDDLDDQVSHGKLGCVFLIPEIHGALIQNTSTTPTGITTLGWRGPRAVVEAA